MNERIRELMWDAGLNSNYVEGFYSIYSEQLERFAKLIVRECLDQCYNRGMNDALYEGQLKAAAYIEEHFGIEK